MSPTNIEKLAAFQQEVSSQAPAPRALDEVLHDLEAFGSEPDLDQVQLLTEELGRSLGEAPQSVEIVREKYLRIFNGKLKGPARFFDRHCRCRGQSKSSVTSGQRLQTKGSTIYEATSDGFVHQKPTKDGNVSQSLTNFTATIVNQIVRDDGAESFKFFEIEAQLDGRTHRFGVEAGRFSSLSWVVEELGPQAVVYAGFGAKDHARAAIQLLSPEIGSTTIYTHLGWRQIEGHESFLHSGGAMGPDGVVPETLVQPPQELALFSLPEPPTDEELTTAVRASLQVLNLLPDPVTLPLFCGIWRAAFGRCDFAMHLSGQTGQGKSEFAALLQQHFGRGLDAHHLPGSWSSTGNALEVLAFAAKDVLLVIDDFAPEGSLNDIQRQHREAARLLRAQGNNSGRQRLRADASLRPTKAPRGLILSTGEDIPKGQSIRARMLALDIPIDGMDWKSMSECQDQAARGVYAQALAGYIRWLAPKLSELRKKKAERVNRLRQEATESRDAHRRTPSIISELAFGLELFVTFSATKDSWTRQRPPSSGSGVGQP